VHIKRIRAPVIAGLLLLALILPQVSTADVPGLWDVIFTNITADSATITWTTNTSSDSRVYYGTITPSTPVYDPTPVTHHYITLEGLMPATVYYFFVASGNLTDDNNGEFWSFETLPGPGLYSITLDPACGVCGDLWKPEYCDEVIEVTAVVAAAGEYHISWDSLTAVVQEPRVGTFTASGAGTYTFAFYMPKAIKGEHTVYLVDSTYVEKAKATFIVNPFVKMVDSKTGEITEEGPVGTEVTLYGYGFGANQAIQIKFNGNVITDDTDKADNKGYWEVPYTIPDTPGGGHTFDIGPKSDPFVVWLRKYFKVTPKITVEPDSGKVKQTITVDGTGFASEEEDIEVTFGEEVRNENIIAKEDGSWTAKIIVPICKCGNYIINASGKTTRARDVDDAEFTVIPGIWVDPPSAYVGDLITVTGGGFEPGETGIKVSFDGMVVPTEIISAVDNYGCWVYSFELPSSAYGEHTVSASGETTAAVTNTVNTLAQITGLSSYERARGDEITLTGSGFGSSKKLTVTVGVGEVKENLEPSRTNGDVVITFNVPKCTLGKQTLKVTDGVATDEVDFTVTKKVLPTPLRISPEDCKLRSGKVTFSWHGITSDSGVTYTYIVEISKDTGFMSGLISEPKTGTTELSYTLPDALKNGTYYWRVKAIDNYGNESEFSASDYSTFKVSVIPTLVWVVVGLVVLVGLMVVAYRETKFKIRE